MNTIEKIRAKAKANPKRIILPEYDDDRVKGRSQDYRS